VLFSAGHGLDRDVFLQAVAGLSPTREQTEELADAHIAAATIRSEHIISLVERRQASDSP
jgi:hypothetical protein